MKIDFSIGYISIFFFSMLFQISIYQPNNGKGVPAEDQPITLPKVPLKSFTYSELPEKYWKKYQYASR